MLGRSLGPGCSHVEKALAGVQRAVLPGLDVGHDGVGEVALVSPVEEGVVDLSRIGSVLGGFEQGHVAERALQRHPQGDPVLAMVEQVLEQVDAVGVLLPSWSWF